MSILDFIFNREKDVVVSAENVIGAAGGSMEYDSSYYENIVDAADRFGIIEPMSDYELVMEV